jgi:hypothetical protein
LGRGGHFAGLTKSLRGVMSIQELQDELHYSEVLGRCHLSFLHVQRLIYMVPGLPRKRGERLRSPGLAIQAGDRIGRCRDGEGLFIYRMMVSCP